MRRPYASSTRSMFFLLWTIRPEAVCKIVDHAATRVNAEQAPKGLTWEPTRREIGEGRRHWGTGGHTPRSDANQWSHRGIGDGMSAEEIRRNTGSPDRWRRVTSNRTPARDR